MYALTGEILAEVDYVAIFPATHFVATVEQTREAIESIRKEILEFVKDFTNDMNGQIDSWLQNQQDLYDIQLKKQLGIRGLEKEEKDHEMGIVNTEKSALKTILTELEGL